MSPVPNRLVRANETTAPSQVSVRLHQDVFQSFLDYRGDTVFGAHARMHPVVAYARRNGITLRHTGICAAFCAALRCGYILASGSRPLDYCAWLGTCNRSIFPFDTWRTVDDTRMAI